jgi:hypothetical protein
MAFNPEDSMIYFIQQGFGNMVRLEYFSVRKKFDQPVGMVELDRLSLSLS